MNISNHKNTILIIILVLLAFFGYWFFFLSKKEAVPTTQNGQVRTATQTSTAGNSQYDKEFVTSLLGLNSVNLDVSIFQSKVYKALSYPEVPFVVNYSRESGRDNPFLPIGVDVQAQTNADPATNPTPAPAVTTPAPKATTPAAPAPKQKQF